jgi:hypothetical protein
MDGDLPAATLAGTRRPGKPPCVCRLRLLAVAADGSRRKPPPATGDQVMHRPQGQPGTPADRGRGADAGRPVRPRRLISINDGSVAWRQAGGVMKTEVVELDLRGLEPPQPMVRILEALAGLSPGSSLRAHTDRRPIHLLPLLEERGFVADSNPQPDGTVVTVIRPR